MSPLSTAPAATGQLRLARAALRVLSAMVPMMPITPANTAPTTEMIQIGGPEVRAAATWAWAGVATADAKARTPPRQAVGAMDRAVIVFSRGDPGVQAGGEARPFVASGRIRR